MGAARQIRNGGNPTNDSGASLVYLGRNADSVRSLHARPLHGEQRNFVNTDNFLPGIPVRCVENCRPL